MPEQRFLELPVTAVRPVADSVISVRLGDPTGGWLPAWRPGAHVPVRLPSGLVRHYSLCGPLDDPAIWEIAVLREAAGRGGSREFHDTVTPGCRLEIGMPRNNFPLLPSDRYLFVAGGIGITPILAMCRAAAAEGVPWTLVYGGRSRSSMAFVDVLGSLPGGSLELVPQDERGFLDLPAIIAAGREIGRIYCCGPAGLLDAMARGATRAGVDLRVERFSPAQPAQPEGDRAFRVRVRGVAGDWTVEPGQSVLHVLREAGVDVLYSCEEGTCGTCETRVLAGSPDHRDSVLTPAERAAADRMMICVSRALSDELLLEVDL